MFYIIDGITGNQNMAEMIYYIEDATHLRDFLEEVAPDLLIEKHV